ncbi:hypothetical protein [Candidatus Cyanaurora vandensis]|uniref:hypothetical protein n=1 Tax=Candidatus Cyanaurora vandensis TaxID=2714958 RepID=UPI00257E5D01|nr:hypothetical protein [Candidatus Cyanaurora vandensis]
MPKGIDPGFDYKPGASQGREGIVQTMLGRLPVELRQSVATTLPSMNPQKPGLAQILAAKEQELRRRDPRLPELAYVLDEQGNVLLEKEGQNDRITFTQAELDLLTGKILTHNHPSGRSLSEQDVDLLLASGLAQIRATGAGYDYSMDLPENPISTYFIIKGRIEAMKSEIGQQLRNQMNSGEITLEEANLLGLHLLWSRLSPVLKVTYRREKFDGI